MSRSTRPVVETRFRAGFLHPRHWPVWLATGLLWLLAYVPHRPRLALARLLAAAYRRLHPKRVEVIRRNLALCFPDRDQHWREALTRQTLEHQAYALVDLGRHWFRSPDYLLSRIDVEGEAHFRQAREEGGVTLLTGHSAGLEWLACYCTIHWSGSSIYKPFKGSALLDWLFTRARTRFSSRMYLREHGLRPHLRTIRDGKAFFYIPDEDLGLENAAFAPFFGQPKATLALLGRIVRLSGRPVLPCMGGVDLKTGRYRLRFLPLIEQVSTDPAASAQSTNQALQALVAADPAQYMWHMKLFKTRPPGLAPVYLRKSPGRLGSG